MVPEAGFAEEDGGRVPRGDGWYVLNARDARWLHTQTLGSYCGFEGDVPFAEFGINLNVLRPGEPLCRYHGENAQEAFLVLSGEALLLVEGEERPLRAWDFVHCPQWTEHVVVGAGDGPCLVLAAGTRVSPTEILYPRADVAVRHDAAAPRETRDPKEAYADLDRGVAGPYREGDLP